MNARATPESLALPIRLTSPYAKTITVSPYGFPMHCEYELDEGEAPILWPTELAHPGSPPTVSLLTCRIDQTEVYDMLSPCQVEFIEEAILHELEN